MQMAADGVKMKPFFFICLPVARRTARRSHYDWADSRRWPLWRRPSDIIGFHTGNASEVHRSYPGFVLPQYKTANQAGTTIHTLYEVTWREFWTPTY